MMQTIHITDDLSHHINSAIEVEVRLTNGERRWCFFVIPTALLEFGDRLDESAIIMHYGAPHMIIVSSISAAIVESALTHIERHGSLMRCTLPLDESLRRIEEDVRVIE